MFWESLSLVVFVRLDHQKMKRLRFAPKSGHPQMLMRSFEPVKIADLVYNQRFVLNFKIQINFLININTTKNK